MLLTRTCGEGGAAALEDPEALGLYNCCLAVRAGGIVVEIGSQLGRSSSLLLQMAKEIGFNSIHIDPYTENARYLPRWMETMQKIGCPFTFLCMTSREAVATGLLPALCCGGIDLLFVDGDHKYPAVRYDLEIGCFVRPKGQLALHDYANQGLEGVKQAAGECLSDEHLWKPVAVTGSLGVWRKND